MINKELILKEGEANGEEEALFGLGRSLGVVVYILDPSLCWRSD